MAASGVHARRGGSRAAAITASEAASLEAKATDLAEHLPDGAGVVQEGLYA